MSFKPENYTSVAPYLTVDDAKRTIAFLIVVFDAEQLRFHAADDGRVKHAEVRIDDTVVMIADSLDGWPSIPAHLHVYVSDVDATYARAIAAGATPVQPPSRKDDDDRRGGFRETGGTTWWIATQMAS